jgi:hypothetical protein
MIARASGWKAASPMTGSLGARGQGRSHRQCRHTAIGVNLGQGERLCAVWPIQRHERAHRVKRFRLGVEVVEKVTGCGVPELVTRDGSFAHVPILSTDWRYRHHPGQEIGRLRPDCVVKRVTPRLLDAHSRPVRDSDLGDIVPEPGRVAGLRQRGLKRRLVRHPLPAIPVAPGEPPTRRNTQSLMGHEVFQTCLASANQAIEDDWRQDDHRASEYTTGLKRALESNAQTPGR